MKRKLFVLQISYIWFYSIIIPDGVWRGRARRLTVPSSTPSWRNASKAEAYASSGVLLWSLRWQRKMFRKPSCQNCLMAKAHSSLLRWPCPWQIRILSSWVYGPEMSMSMS